MRRLSILALLFVCVCLPCQLFGKVNEAQLTLSNRLKETIRLEFLTGKSRKIGDRLVRVGEQAKIGDCRRIVIHFTHESYEFSLPEVLDVHSISGKNYVNVIGGKWLLIARNPGVLEIEWITGGDASGVGGGASAMPDFSKPQFGFPIEARRLSETFDEYKARLAKVKREALTRTGTR